MRYAIISDVHANLEALQVVLARIDHRSIDQVICLGDVVGYNANPNECCEIIRERDIPTVSGNHDAAVSGLEEPWGFNPIAHSAALWSRSQLTAEHITWLRELPANVQCTHFLGVHGTPTDRDAYMFAWEDVLAHTGYVQEQGQWLCFFGHTHCPGLFAGDGTYALDDQNRFPLDFGERGEGPEVLFINPGSVGQPRDGDPRAAYGILDTDAGYYELVRVEYAVQTAADGIIKAGLPGFLAERLFLGR